MELFLESATFENDFFYIEMPEGDTLVLNKVDESLGIEGYSDVNINAINIEVVPVEGDRIKCPCVIGLGNNILEIVTDHKELEGKLLTSDNMKYCKINIYE